MHVEHAYPIVTRMAESRPEEAVVASRYNFRVVTTGQEFVSVSDYPTCMVRGPSSLGSLGSRRRTLPQRERIVSGKAWDDELLGQQRDNAIQTTPQVRTLDLRLAREVRPDSFLIRNRSGATRSKISRLEPCLLLPVRASRDHALPPRPPARDGRRHRARHRCIGSRAEPP